jgi:hypothetical protein
VSSRIDSKTFDLKRFSETDEDDYEDEDYRKKKRSREVKLDAMDRKLKAMENLIIEDTAKYYENHDGMAWAARDRAKQLKFCFGISQELSVHRKLELCRVAWAIASQPPGVWRKCEKPSSD